MRVTDKHVFFYSYRDVFSNHYQEISPFSNFDQKMKGIYFHTGEHYMMYEKAMLFGDKASAERIIKAVTPQGAKTLGRKVKNFDQAVWDENKFNIVTRLVYSRMCDNGNLRELAVGYRKKGLKFVEASPRDRIWGIGMEENHPMVDDESFWCGENLLGKAWDEATDMIIDVSEAMDMIGKCEAY